ncbi:Macrolide export protein MacA [Pirellulimonas nuda]|uniref:Macrolide export protein MacA n=1 Tax=Pirellulimonas nuda TaxID=2528009 RepID=A0A518D9V4_9BACT|nr:HlyD family efflux transporter periplasmic adaptor subunit [Pirellulimonas nuda]QDU88262.1 Macrolide export protein MacA [Pirellulimonas nuda]
MLQPTGPNSVEIRRAGAAGKLLLTGLLLAAGVTAAWVMLAAPESTTQAIDEAVLYQVDRGDFELAITERGEVESVGDVEIRSEVKNPAGSNGLSILKIVPEGAVVDAGEFLVQLDSAALEADRTIQKIAVNTAKAAEVEARNLFETSVIAKQEYQQGLFIQERQTIESEMFVAEEDLSRARDYLTYSNRLGAKGYVSEQQIEADEFAVEQAKKVLDAAKTKLMVLEDFTKAKMVKTLESDIAINEAKWGAAQNSYELEAQKLRDIEQQIASCTIVAPSAGVVKYSHVRDRGGQDDFIVEEGAVVRERQTIIRLPDLSTMRVEMKVNESLVQYVKAGMPALIRPIGVDGAVIRGVVERVNQYAEPSGWRKANVKEYMAYIRIEGDTTELRTGMTASVTIKSMFTPNVLQAPVQAVYSHGPDSYCFVARDGALVAQRVECGPTNDRFYVIQNGLDLADHVAVNPRKLLRFVSLPELPAEKAQQAVSTGVAEPEPTAERTAQAESTPAA